MLGSPRKSLDEDFEKILEREFIPDLSKIVELATLQKEGLISEKQKELLDYFKDKYQNGCPNGLVHSVSWHLKEEYSRIEKEIKKHLY